MTKNSPATDDRWAVSNRTHGEVLTAGVTLPSIELALLGIPQGFTPVEIQSWLRDLAGVAIETSRSDERERPIPQLLHHALTGLLFSQTELWSHTGQALPCAAVFVDGPNGTAFGWVGRARVTLLVNGEPYEPQWVIVRDEAGHEAMSAMMPPESHVLMTLEYWPDGENGTPAPASLDAEVGHAYANRYSGPPASPAVTVPPAEPSPAPASSVSEVATSYTSAVPEPPATTPEHLPTQQPGLAPDPSSALDQPDSEQSLPSTFHPSAGTFAIPPVPARGAARGTSSDEVPPSALWSPDPAGRALRPMQRQGASEPKHPVGRWLSRLMSFGRREEPAAEPTSAAPVSAYDAMLSPDRSARPDPDDAPAEPAATLPPAAPVDIAEPHALPDTAGLAAPPRPVPTPLRRGGLAPAGLDEILGSSASGTSTQKAASPAGGGARAAVPPEPPTLSSPGSPPYPMLEVAPPRPVPHGPIEIEREPVGADEAFAIPKLPPRETPKPVRAPAPETFVARGTPAATLPAASAPATPQPPVLRTPGASAPPPDVPEPPADFLAEFAASMRVEPAAEPAPAPEPLIAPHAEPEPPPAAAPPRSVGPPSLPPTLRSTAPTARPAAPPTPGQRAVTPPTLAPSAAAQPAPAKASAPAPAPAPAPVPAPPAAWPRPAAVNVVVPRPAAPTPPPAPAPAIAPPIPLPAPEPPVLRAPSPPDPAQLAAADVAALMRELPLPTPSAEMARPAVIEVAPDDDGVPEGMLVATRAKPMPAGARSRLAAGWPAPEELERVGTPPWRKPWLVGTFVAVLFGIGWLVGHSQAPDNDVHATPMSRLLRTVGLGGARFTVLVDTDPPGAWIAVDGKDLGKQTPSTMELVPGGHQVTLSMPDLGSVQVAVKGSAGQKVKVNEALHGSLDVTALDPAVPVKMSLDGAPQGWLPAHVDKLPPGLHELQFSGPNMPPWGQNVSIGIRQTTSIVARPMMSPATGVVEVQASLNDDSGTAPLSGANVFVDGDLRGTTPLTLELPRGPHSLRVTYRTETAPVQVIDLPGGNRRFASFQFGLDSDLPPLRLQGNYASLAGKRPVTVSASLDGLDPRDVRDSWLHVRSPEGLWRRYEMAVTRGPRGAVLAAPFPPGMFDGEGRVTWYASAATAQGDEFYTEMQRSSR